MPHEWIFEVLTDMKAYAEKHGLVALSAKIDETLDVARAEIDEAEGQPDSGGRAAPTRRTRN